MHALEYCFVFFFFKQKTAYEMRISDWSSDVCSSDLSDGVFRAVISARDPGVHNWLDTSGYLRGASQGRWVDTDDKPTPTIRKGKVDEVLYQLPQATRRVTPEQRYRRVRDRRAGASMRTTCHRAKGGLTTHQAFRKTSTGTDISKW